MRWRWRLAAVLMLSVLFVASDGGAHAAAADPQEAAGEFPVAGGIALVLWNGGPLERLADLAVARGCEVRSAWTTVQGDLIGYVPSAPNVVNAAFLRAYPFLVLPTNTALLLLCAPTSPVARPAGSGALPLNVIVIINAGVTSADEAFVRDGALAAQAYLEATFGGGIFGRRMIAVHPGAASTLEIAPGRTACCYTSSRSTNIFAAHPDWVGAMGTVQPFGFDARVYIMAHEYAHLWQAEIRCMDSRVPSWFVEGVAEYIGLEAAVRARLITADQRVRFDTARALVVPGAATLAGLERHDVFHATNGAYGLSSVAVGRALVGLTPRALHDFCVDVGANATWQAAFTKHFGKSPDAFYQEFEVFRSTLR